MSTHRTGEWLTRSARALAAGLLLVLLAVSVAQIPHAKAQGQPGDVPQGLRETPVEGTVPGGALGNTSDTDFWRAIRQGSQGTVSIPDKKAAQLIQSEGETFRSVRNGPLSLYGAWLLLGVIIVLAAFFIFRGRIRIDSGRSGRTITRFNELERFGHWLIAVSFIILGLSGLNVLYGRYVLLPVIGPDAFAALTVTGKWLHNFVSFSFMVGLVLVFVLWVTANIPSRIDLEWLAKGGGLFTKGSHPPSRKFNAGQKVIFWLVVLSGVSLSLTGIALLFPFEISYFAKTFAVLNVFGLDLPTTLTAVQEQQLNQLWHAILALVMTAVILAHIYIGTIGMEGAFDAMGSGEVDLNWAKEHHNLWVEEETGKAPSKAKAKGKAAAQPAE